MPKRASTLHLAIYRRRGCGRVCPISPLGNLCRGGVCNHFKASRPKHCNFVRIGPTPTYTTRQNVALGQGSVCVHLASANSRCRLRSTHRATHWTSVWVQHLAIHREASASARERNVAAIGHKDCSHRHDDILLGYCATDHDL